MPVNENRFLCALLTVLTLGIYRFFSVPQGYVRFITAFGRFIRHSSPGLGHCVSFWGLYQTPERLVPIMEQRREYPEESVFTRDGVQCLIDTVVFFTLVDPFKAIYGIQDYEAAICSLVQSTLRNECGNLAARELLAGREKLVEQLSIDLEQGATPWGITIRLVEITDIAMKTNGKGDER